jgi:hypothetical protein
MLLILLAYRYPENSFKLGKSKVTFVPSMKTVSILDGGEFNKKVNPENFVRFELKPTILFRYGTRVVELLELSNFSERTFRAAIELIRELSVKKVVVPFVKDVKKRSAFFFFYKMKEVASERGVKILRS